MDNTTNEATYRSSYVSQQGDAQSQKPPKRRHTGLIIGLSVLAVLILGGVAAFIFAKDVIVNKFMLMTKSEVEYFRWVADREIDTVCEYAKNAEVRRGTAEGLFGEEGSGTVRGTLKTHTSDAFTEMLGIYPIKDAGISTAVSFNKDSFAMSMVPEYGDNRLFTLNALVDIAGGKIEAELPDYKPGIVDLSSLLDKEGSDGKKLKDVLGDAMAEARESIKTNRFDAGAFAEKYRRYTKALIDEIEDVELKTDSYASVGDDSVKCTEIRISVTGKELKTQLKSLYGLLSEDYGDEIKSALEQYSKSLGQTDVDKMIDSISDDLTGRLTLYVNNKADLIAIDIKGTYTATTIGAKIRWEKTEDGTEGKIGLSLNQINALNITFESRKDEDGSSFLCKLLPDAFVDTFLGNYQGLSAEYEHKTTKDSTSDILKLNRNGEELAKVSVNTVVESFTGHVLDETSKSIYPIENITENGYFSLSEAASFVFGLLDKINEPELEKKIDELLAGFLGEGFTLDSIRKMIDNGMLDILGGGILGPDDMILGLDDEGAGTESNGTNGTGNNGAGTDISGTPGTGDNTGNIPGTDQNDPLDQGNGSTSSSGDDVNGGQGADGTAELYPTERIPITKEYPELGKDYYYSYAELAEYAKPGQYKGRIFTMPEPMEITPEVFEEEKKKFLDSYENVILVDQTTARVEMGDEIYVDILPFLYGIAFENFHYEDSYAKIGEDMYGPGLDEQIIGMKVGESKDIVTTLGSQYGDFAGIEATFRVTVSKIERYVEPEWSEEFICHYMGFDSLDACSDALMEALRGESEVTDSQITFTLLQEAVSETECTDVPKDAYDRLWNSYYNRLYDLFDAYGSSPEEMFEEDGIDSAELYEMLDEDVRANLKSYCFYAAVAKQENIKLTGAELIDKINNEYLDETNDYNIDTLLTGTRLQSIIDDEIEKIVEQMIRDTAVIKEN